MQLNKNILYNVEYVKTNPTTKEDEKSQRSIIPLNEIPETVTALDITDLSLDDADHLSNKMQEYQQYVDQHLSLMFNFNTWYEQTENKQLDKKFQKIRKFSLNRLTVV